MWKSLRVQVAVAYGLAVLALVVTLALVLGWWAAEASQREQSRLLQTLARSTGMLLAEGMDERLREVRTLAEAHPAQVLEDWRPALQRLQAARPQYSWIGVVRPDGTVATATGGLLQGASVATRAWFQGGLQGSFVGDVHPAKLLATLLPPSPTGELLRFVDFAAPVRDVNGTLQAVLGVHLTWDWAREVAQRLHGNTAREAGAELFIIDKQGRIVLSPAGVDPEQSLPRFSPDAETGLVQAWGDGRVYLSAAAPVVTQLQATQLGWAVVVRQPLHLATATARAARNTALMAAAVAALLAGVVAWVLAGRVSRPLGRIAIAARALRAGRLDTEIPHLSGTRELAELSVTLRDMTASLLQRKAELAQANQGLEQRVHQRTSELLLAQRQLQAANTELETLARRDGLTGLLNRRGADEQLAHEFARHRRNGRPFSVAVIDIDHFKAVNDTHGHAAGDEVLRDVAHALADQVRQSDLVARQGGEEFLLLMPETDLAGARKVCEKLRAAVAAVRVPLLAAEAAGDSRAVAVTISIGLAGMVAGEAAPAGPAMLVEAADRALYAAKQAGRNRVVSGEAVPA